MLSRLSPAAALLPLLAVPALAQDTVPPEAELVLSCSIIFSLKASDAKDAGDAGAETEWTFRSDELEARGRGMLADAGWAEATIEDVVINYALTVSFNTTLGAPPFTDQECFALSE